MLTSSVSLINILIGESWCPYCVRAKPVVEKVVEDTAPEDSHFIVCEIDRPL